MQICLKRQQDSEGRCLGQLDTLKGGVELCIQLRHRDMRGLYIVVPGPLWGYVLDDPLSALWSKYTSELGADELSQRDFLSLLIVILRRRPLCDHRRLSWPIVAFLHLIFYVSSDPALTV